MSETQTDHGRVIGSGAWFGGALGVTGLGWVNLHIPHLCGFLLDWSVVLTVCYVMARWKRAWYAWAAFWGMAGVCVLGGSLQLLGLLTSQWSTGSWVVGCCMVFVWYWLVRAPRRQPPPAPQEQHIYYHHVIHAPDGAAVPWPVEAGRPGVVPAGVEAGRRLEIEAPKIRPARFAEAVREAVRRNRT